VVDPGEPHHRVGIEMIIVIVGNHHGVDGRQVVEP
jgi:hypothetical protein